LKIDIGPMYSHPPKERKLVEATSFYPIERELVFDIDLSDYDTVRSCCSGKKVCGYCWPFITLAIKCIDTILRNDFGFSLILWVFSGRRGIHCWVCDERARKLSVAGRGSVAEYIAALGNNYGKGVISDNWQFVTMPRLLHPTLQRLYDTILLDYFETVILFNQNLFTDADTPGKGWKSLLLLLPEKIRKELSEEWEQETGEDGERRWQQFKDYVTQAMKKEIKNSNPIYDVVFTYTYPRLDINVSKGMNHLLKAPFCIHPDTRKVCVPIDMDIVEDFESDEVPTLDSLLADLSNKELDPNCTTAMKKYVDIFEKTILIPLRCISRTQKQQQRDKASADSMDF